MATAIGASRSIAGTLEFMAPEVILGEPSSPASDIYAVGVIACELLSGQYPFDCSSARGFLRVVLGSPAAPLDSEQLRRLEPLCRRMSFSAEESPAAAQNSESLVLARINPPALRSVVQRMMAREPSQRFESAEVALAALGEAAGISYEAALAGTRESFLQASRLVGRERELSALNEALDDAAVRGKGGVWLIGGESGVGKSRLLEELRATALIRGVQVVRGQAHSEGSQPYQEWSEVLRPLCLGIQLEDLSAAVLKGLLFGLPELLERTIADAPELDPAATQQRLINTALKVLLCQPRPTLVLLEDLHAASVESIALLRKLLQEIAGHSLLVLASYRIDERASLPAELPGCRSLRVERLAYEHIAQLSSLMLGEIGQSETVISFVAQESEGNAFFMIEVVRALAEGAGGWEGARSTRRPLSLHTGDMRAVLERRLQRVAPEWRELLLLTAVAGRQVDLALLAIWSPRMDEFLRACANAAVLEPIESQWRFSHDKLREAALASLSAEERRQRHGQVAAAIMQAHSEPSANAAALAFHYGEAGELGRAAHYSALAGEQALSQGALSEAAKHLEQALSLQEQTPVSQLQQLRTRRLLVAAQFGLGHHKACTLTHEEALRRLGLGLSRSPWKKLGAAVSEVAQQVLHRCGSRFVQRPRDAEERMLWTELLLLWSRSAEAYIMLGNADLAGQGVLVGLNLAEGLEDTARQVFLYTFLAYGFGLIPQRQLSRYYLSLAERHTHAIGDLRTSLEFLRISALMGLGEGRFQDAERDFSAAAELARRIGDDYLRTFCIATWHFGIGFQGHRERQRRMMIEIQRLAQRMENAQYLAICQIGLGSLALQQNDCEQCMVHLTAAAEYCDKSQDLLNRLQLDSTRALCMLRSGDPEAAQELAAKALRLLPTLQLSSVGLLPGFEALCSVYLELWEDHPHHCQHAPVRLALRALLERFARLARLFPVARPYWLLMSGRYAACRGLLTLAMRQLRQSLRSAEALGMNPAAGLAHLFLGRLGVGPLRYKVLGADSQQHLTDAIEIFENLDDRRAADCARRIRDQSYKLPH